MAKKGGRPTDYSQDILTKTKDYIDNHKDYGDEIPSVAGLSSYLNIARSTIYEWASQDDKKEFSDILEKLLSTQEKTLINKGLNGGFNSTITKLILTKHGYTDKADVTTGGEKLNLSFDNAFAQETKRNS